MGALSTTAIAALAFVVGWMLKRKSTSPKAVPWLWLVAGFGLSGLAGDLLVQVSATATNAVTTAGAHVFGVGVPTLLVLAIGVLLVLNMKPKASPSKSTPWLALLFPSVLATAGGAFTGLHERAGTLLAQGGQGLSVFFSAIVEGI